MAKDNRGWHKESERHSLAAKGIKTGTKTPQQMRSDAKRIVNTDSYKGDQEDNDRYEVTIQDRVDDLDMAYGDEVDDEVKADFIRAMDEQNEDVEGSWDWRILDQDGVESTTKEYIEESVWAFNPDFLAAETGIDTEAFSSIQDMCEGANPAIKSMIEATCGMDHFIEEAVLSDGYGHFLSSYDGEEYEFVSGDTRYFAYRV